MKVKSVLKKWNINNSSDDDFQKENKDHILKRDEKTVIAEAPLLDTTSGNES